jgi:hypothetical protein
MPIPIPIPNERGEAQGFLPNPRIGAAPIDGLRGAAYHIVRENKGLEKKDTKELRVISASRRTDLVGCHPEFLAKRLEEYPPESVHSVVLWTKNPRNIIEEGPLRKVLGNYRQVFVHLTITGMGGGEFEPHIPPWEETVGMIGPLADLVGDRRRICWRFDPIVEVEGRGKTFSNFDLFPRLADPIAAEGIETCRVSWVSPYKKVAARLCKQGWRLVDVDPRQRKEQADRLERTAASRGMKVYFCSMEGFPVSRCIDGERLSETHPDGLTCSRRKARGQRQLCGCTESLDIGWYSLQCSHGCLYCYASP